MKKVLFLTTLPPPHHGASMSSAMCLDILTEDQEIEVRNVKLNSSVNTSDLGKITLKKLIEIYYTLREIVHQIKNFKPDIIYYAPAVTGVALYRDCFFLQIIRYLNNRNKILLHIRGQFKEREWNNALSRATIKRLLKCNKAIVLGPELVANLKGMVSIENIYILPNALPETLSQKEFLNIIDKKNRQEDLMLLFISNMDEFKGWRKVLETCKLLSDLQISYICNFLGAWPSPKQKQDFYEYVKANRLDQNIIYNGLLLNEDKNNIFKRSHILIFPTSYDACPRVVIEAMEFGLPVISTNVGTIPSLIDDNITGYILKENNAEEILKSVLELRDPDVRIEMGLKARKKFLEEFTLSTYKKSFLAIFQNN